MAKTGGKSGRNSRTSKTARVLSLLTDPDSAGENTQAEDSAHDGENTHAAAAENHVQEPQSAQRGGIHHNKAETEAQIRDALAQELEALAPSAPQAVTPPAPQPAAAAPTDLPQPAAVTVPEPVPAAPAPVPAPEPEPEPVQPAPASVPQPPRAVPAQPEPVQAAPAPAAESALAQNAPAKQENTPLVIKTSVTEQPEEKNEYAVLNVTQALVEEKTKKYMKMFGMCSCERCRIDVIALALSNLPAKYVVVKGDEINPRLSFYESKYSAAVITQVMSACKKVLDKPHHKR